MRLFQVHYDYFYKLEQLGFEISVNQKTDTIILIRDKLIISIKRDKNWYYRIYFEGKLKYVSEYFSTLLDILREIYYMYKPKQISSFFDILKYYNEI